MRHWKPDRVGTSQAFALQGIGEVPAYLGQHRKALGIRMAVVEAD